MRVEAPVQDLLTSLFGKALDRQSEGPDSLQDDSKYGTTSCDRWLCAITDIISPRTRSRKNCDSNKIDARPSTKFLFHPLLFKPLTEFPQNVSLLLILDSIHPPEQYSMSALATGSITKSF
ncbi:hypothetical protein RRG08_021367 [Elysia crispata]|uniref:Uncharacterized protein n=1 Tax=Elysia crispata TaxID=231223 RepID=A0AAE0YBM5_9GAST|nr:hypothetical protein RRG08_021367 [Elysia crispata]